MSFGVEDQRVLWPGYVYPNVWDPANCAWFRFADHANPGSDGSGSVAIANPASGPGTIGNPDWTSAINYCRNRGHQVIGYVHTQYGIRSMATVKAEVDTWFGLYGVTGIFVDEFATDVATQPYYAELYDYVQRKRGVPGRLVVGNPGTSPASNWAIKPAKRCADVLCVHENTAEQYLTWQPAAWMSDYPASTFAHLVHACSQEQLPAVLEHAQATGAGYRYVTDDVLPNPWDSLAYWPAQATP